VALRARNPSVAPGLERVIHRLLQKDPDQRYQSYGALTDDVERVARGEEPLAGAEPPARRVQQGDTTYLIHEQGPTELVLRPAGFVRRLCAFTVDVIAVDFVLRLCFALCRALLGHARSRGDVFVQDFDKFRPTQATLLIVALVAAAFFYFVSSDAQGGRSIGKRWFNLRICRRDGRDLGVVRALLRTIVVFPGVALIVPTSANALAFATRSSSTASSVGQLLLGAGWLLALYFIGSASAAGRPLQDALVGAIAYRAARPRGTGVLVHGRRALSPARALRLSLVPGLGVMYAGRVLVGLLVMAAICALVVTHPVLGLCAWTASAAYAYKLASRQPIDEPATGQRPPVEDGVRRQES